MITTPPCGRLRAVPLAVTLFLAGAMTTLDGQEAARVGQSASGRFTLREATIARIQQEIRTGRITTVGLVELYLKRIKAYNGTCVNQPQGILGPVTTIPHAGQLNALSTLNLRPAVRKAWGFDDRKA